MATSDEPVGTRRLDPQLTWLFVYELEYQCVFAQNAYRTMLQALQKPPAPGSQETVYWMIHSFLTHVAMISKILWPDDQLGSVDKQRVGPERVATLQEIRNRRGPDLVSSLGISETPVVRDKRLRNDLEHYDERLESWAVSSPQRIIALRNIAPRGAISGIAQSDEFISLDSATLELSFQERQINLAQMKSELDHIHEAVVAWKTKHPTPWS